MAVGSLHRMLLVGPSQSALAGFAGALQRAGVQTRYSDDVAIAGAMATEAQTSVVVVVGDLRLPQIHEMLATLSVLPSTSELPVFVLSREADLKPEIDAFTAGAVDVVRLPTELPRFVARIHQHLSPEPNQVRTRAAKDLRGPALLKRIGNHIRSRQASACLNVIGPPDGGLIEFKQGRIEKARFGHLEGSAAIERLLTTPTSQRWAIRLGGGAVAAQSVDVPDAVEPTFTIDIDVDLDVDASPPKVPTPSPAALPQGNTRTKSVDLDVVVMEPPPSETALGAAGPDFDEIDLDDETDAIDLFEVSQVSAPPSIADLAPVDETTLAPPVVLVVDDDEALVKIYSNFLARNGAQVVTASDGQEGYAVAVKTRPDAIVSDIMMPNVDGWGFLTLVRHDMRIRDTKFLLLSCHGEYLTQLQTLDAGADAYLEKGLRGDEVAKHVEDALSDRRKMAGSLQPGIAFSGQLATYGVRPLLRALAAAGLSGVLTIEDRFGRYLIQLEMGRLVASMAAVGETERTGDEALTAVLNLDDGDFDFESDVLMLVDEAPRDLEAVINEIGAALNKRRKIAEERMFASDAKLVANDQLATFYSLVCPEAARPVADALCHGVAPRDVMATSDASPLLIESVVRDLLRKGVAQFAT